jgi:hypothetical protein
LALEAQLTNDPRGYRRLTRKGEEDFAVAFEVYLGDRTAINGATLMWMEKLRTALGNLWRQFRGRATHLSPEMKDLFDEFLGFKVRTRLEAHAVARKTRGARTIPTVGVEALELWRLEADTKSRKAKAREALRVDLDRSRLLSKFGIAEDATSVDPYTLYTGAVRHVAEEMAKRFVPDDSVVVTRRCSASALSCGSTARRGA